ncbi:MAG TPA: glutaredoxin domain-containing protein [Candidatus Omnitrophota bacterium]|nr:glutaredoxin domain-containing protein [Candidatus Omnitrophota bacterium]
MPKKVTVYSTPTCPYCTRAKQFLTDNRIAFDNVDVSVDTGRAEEMIQKSGQMGVPVLDIDGEIIVGFDRERIQRALGLT